MEEDKNEYELKIPENTSDRDDYIQGIGLKEVIIIVIALIIDIVLVACVYLSSGNIIAGLCTAAFLLGIVIITVKRDLINENLIDKIRILCAYIRLQKVLQYRQYDLWEDEKYVSGSKNDSK